MGRGFAFVLALGLAAFTGGRALAEPTTCPRFYLDGAAPDITDPGDRQGVQEFCYYDFAVFHSSVTRTPLWSAERLTRQMVQGGRSIGRRDRFHPEARLAPADRAEYRDYTHSGFARGHMTPSDDAPDFESQHQTFVMANMVPQVGRLNSGLWRYLEASVAQRAMDVGEIYVVTGPVFPATPTTSAGVWPFPAIPSRPSTTRPPA